MKTISVAVVVSWLGSAVALDFKDLVVNNQTPALDSRSDEGVGSRIELQGDADAPWDDFDKSFIVAIPALGGLDNSGESLTEDLGSVSIPEAFNHFEALDKVSDLAARQTRRCRAGYYLCGSGCCPSGSTCASNGCCPGGTRPCGSRGCYNPVSEICCGGIGQSCRRGYTCLSTRCCPSGHRECGSRNCYNPNTSICCGATGTYCPKGYDCLGLRCCPSGHKLCGSANCYNPNSQNCCGSSGRTCPKNFDCVANGLRCCPKGLKLCGSRCYDPRTQTCCESTSTTCPKNKDCVKGGCCPKGEKPCGNNKCYNPRTEKCCPANSGLCSRAGGVCTLDTVCPQGQTCVGSNQCCPDGHEKCGENHCYDPKTQVCCSERGTTCPKNFDCVRNEDGPGCCPKGTSKCGKDKCYDPEKSTCCMNSKKTKIWTCSSGSQCCLASEGCFDPKTQRCCGGSTGPCALDEACCGGVCCAKGQICKGGKCQKAPNKRPSTKSNTCTTPTATSQPVPAKTIEFKYDPARVVRARHPPGSTQKMVVSNHAVLINMCRGIAKLNGKPGQQAKLTHGGKCWQKWNRDQMCPKGWCANGVKDYINQFYPDKKIPPWAKEAITAAGDMSCDEFPFASSLQGGDPATGVRICVPADDNGFQGTTMSKFFNRHRPQILEGQDYVIEIVGWDCTKQAPSESLRRDVMVDHFLDPATQIWNEVAKRDAFNDKLVRYGDEMYHGFDTGNSRLNLMTMPLGDLEAGSYLVNLNATKGNFNYVVVDSVGNTVDTTVLTNGSVQFLLDSSWEAVTLAGVTEDEQVEISYQAVAQAGIVTADSAPTSTQDPAPAPAPTDNAGTSVSIGDAFAKLVVMCAMGVFAL